jgi:hypothetical protein
MSESANYSQDNSPYSSPEKNDSKIMKSIMVRSCCYYMTQYIEIHSTLYYIKYNYILLYFRHYKILKIVQQLKILLLIKQIQKI